MTSTAPATELRLVEQTRSAVLNVMIVSAAGVALTGLALRGRDRGATLWSPDLTRRACYLTLLLLVMGSTAARRILGSRTALRDPETRAGRFRRSHLVGAVLGALAVPLGLLYGFAIEPRLQAVTPFWVAALALGVLSLPRAEQLDGFDEPLPVPQDGSWRSPAPDEAGR